MAAEYPTLGNELDKESWDWLSDNHPKIADALSLEVNRGATPDDLFEFVKKRIGAHRSEFARRCETAARYLLAVKK